MKVDAGSIDKYGIELASLLVVGIEGMAGSNCYDSAGRGAKSAPFLSGLHRL